MKTQRIKLEPGESAEIQIGYNLSDAEKCDNKNARGGIN